uniref:Uncharacterized protein LOC111137353 n=1 Tax=Crassostrea virginica TaxID=6565 RepID=A0A8B8EY60_CRAVI|nr:uncharacterized protein LOC111137353 [Crassostrea virginica]
MEYRLVLCLHLLSFVPHSAIKNRSSANYCEVLIWGPWSTCSNGCGRGLRHRLPGLCCPKGVTAQTIYDECAVKLCNMTEGDYNQTGACSSTLGCTSATPETTQTTLPIAVSSIITTKATTLGTASPEVTTKPTPPGSVIPEITTKWTPFGGSPEVKTIVPPPFGMVTLMTLSAALLAALASCVVCAVFAVKRRQDKKRRNSVLPHNS